MVRLTGTEGTFAAKRNGLADTSAKKLKKTARSVKKKNLSKIKGDISIAEEVIVANGYEKSPTAPVSEPEDRSADYYRYGAAEVEVDGQTQQVAGGEVSPLNIQYDQVPRLLEDFDDKEASIRLFGKKQGSKQEADLLPPYTKFILQSAQESYNEKSQVVETFGDYYVFFFGQRPIIYNFTGTLINTKSTSWLNDWKFMYQNFFRGTKAVESKARIILSYGGRQIEGYILSTSNQTQASADRGVQFSFQMILIDEKFVNFSNDFGIIVTNGQLAENQDFMQLLVDGPLSKADVDRALTHARNVMEKINNPKESDVPKAEQQGAINSDFGINTIKSVTGNLRLSSAIPGNPVKIPGF